MNQFSLPQSISLLDDLSSIESWHEGRLILIDKPLDWTSFDLVNKSKISLRDGLGIRKSKIGHAGTLDPKATGLMILLTGKFTKMTDYIHTFDKTYDAVFFIGATTPCYDTERPIDAHYAIDHITNELIYEVSNKFKGKIIQYPPAFSAVKIDGHIAYKAARKGKEVITRAREVEVFDFNIQKIELPFIHIKIRCSSGTYIRSIANDMGKALGSGAYLAALKRTSIGPWSLSNAYSIDDFVNKIRSYQMSEVIQSIQ